jgi:hypothetical protein
MSVSRQLVAKHIPAEAVEHLLLGNDAVNRLCQQYRMCFYGSASRLYKWYRTESSQPWNENENGASPRQSKKKSTAED